MSNAIFIKVKRFVLTGPSGCGRKEVAGKLKDAHKLTHIDTGALIKLELAKKTDNATKIQEAIDSNSFGKYFIFWRLTFIF